MPQIKRFKGLNNVSDPLRLGLNWLVSADNVHITDAGAIEKRSGFSLAKSGAFTSAYSTIDFSRCYTADVLSIKTFEGIAIFALTSSAPMYWAEINDQVFFNNGTDRGIIRPDNSVVGWAWPTPGVPTVAPVTGTLAAGTYQVRCTYLMADGRETGTGDPVEITMDGTQAISISDIPHVAGALTRVYIAPANSDVYQLAMTTTGNAFVWNFSNDALGTDLRNAFLDSIPVGTDVIQFFKGRAYAAQYMADANQTVVWYSESLGFHLFNLNSDYFMVPGRVLMLAPSEDALIVGTESRVYAFADNKITELVKYGVVAGQHWAIDKEKDTPPRTIFWTTRGVCSALPFTNLTEQNVSVAPGIKAGGTIVRDGGQKRYLTVLQQGGSAFNSI